MKVYNLNDEIRKADTFEKYKKAYILQLPLGFFLFIVWTPHFCGFPTQNHQPHRSHINTESSEGYKMDFANLIHHHSLTRILEVLITDL